MNLADLLAQSPAPAEAPALIVQSLLAIVGGVVSWFMWRFEKKMTEMSGEIKSLSKSVNTNTQSNMVVALSIQHSDAAVAKLASQVKADAEAQLNENPNR